MAEIQPLQQELYYNVGVGKGRVYMRSDAFMSYSDDRILPVIRAIEREGVKATLTEISQRSGVPYGTVKDRINALIRQNRIRRTGHGRRWGSHFEVCDDGTSNA